MGAFVLVTAGVNHGVSITASQVFERLLLLLLSEGFWPYVADDGFGRNLRPGDGILFCLLADEGPLIVGDALVASPAVPVTSDRLGHIALYLGPAVPVQSIAFSHCVVLTQWRIMDEPRVCVPGRDPGEDAVIQAIQPPVGTGAVRPLGAEAFQRLTGRVIPNVELSSEPEAASPILGVCDVRAFVLANWSLVDFGEPLKPLPWPGTTEDSTASGIDLVCENPRTKELVAIMWANGDLPAAALAKARACLAQFRKTALAASRTVRGLVLTADPNAATHASLGQVGPPRVQEDQESSRAPAGADQEHVELRRVRVYCEPVRNMGLRDWRQSPSPVSTAIPTRTESRTPLESSPQLEFAAKCLQVPRARRVR